MKQYVIDELRPADHDKIRSELAKRFGPPRLGGVYWVPLDPALLSAAQVPHGECRPFYFALELQERSLSCELLVRTGQRVRCSCIAYATPAQRNWIIAVVDGMLAALGITV